MSNFLRAIFDKNHKAQRYACGASFEFLPITSDTMALGGNRDELYD
jgi:hypothetical protein